MRILHISSAKTFGGGERHLVDLCRELAGRGHEVFVALRPSSEWQDRLSFLPPDNIFHVSIRNSFGMLSAKRIGRFIQRNQIDVVHAHVARDYLAASVAARSAGNVKLVLTRHVVFALKPFHRFALRNVAAVIAVSGRVRLQMEKIFPPDKIRLISNGLDLFDGATAKEQAAAEFRAFHDIPTDAPLVVTLGELIILKGQRDFVLAANEVVKAIPDCRFVIAGKDNSMDQKFRRELKRLVRVFGMEDRFIWLDWLDDISPLLAAADLFVSPSHSESFGLAILEAMAAGTPVVATSTDGALEIIPEPSALVPVKDPLAMAEKTVWYLRHPKERRELGRRLAEIAHDNYGLQQMIDATEAVYREIYESDARADGGAKRLS